MHQIVRADVMVCPGPGLSARERELLSLSDDPLIEAILKSNERRSAAFWFCIAQKRSTSVKRAMIQSKTADGAALAELARQRSRDTRLALIRKTDLQPQVIQALIETPDPIVPIAPIACCPSITDDQLRFIAGTAEYCGDSGVGASPLRVPFDRLVDLVPMKNGALMHLALSQPRIPLEFVKAVVERGSDEDFRKLCTRKDILDRQSVELLAHRLAGSRETIEELAREDLTEALCAALIAGEPFQRRYLARCDGLPFSLHAVLARDDDPTVRAELAARQSMPDHLLLQMCADSSVAVRRAIATRPDLPRPVPGVLLADPVFAVREALLSDPGLAPEEIRRLATIECEAGRLCIAARDDVPGDVAITLAGDPSERVRMSLAANSSISLECRLQLAADASESVRDALVVSLARYTGAVPSALVDTQCANATDRVFEFYAARDDLANPAFRHLLYYAVFQSSRRLDLVVADLKRMMDSRRFPLLDFLSVQRLFAGSLVENGRPNPQILAFADLLGENRPKRACRALIGSSHREEVRALFRRQNPRGPCAIPVLREHPDDLVCLQRAFAIAGRPADRYDRHSYLDALSILNESWLFLEDFERTFEPLKACYFLLGREELRKLLVEPVISGSDGRIRLRDTLRMVCSYVNGFPRRERREALDAISRRLKLGHHRDTRLHDFLNAQLLERQVSRRHPSYSENHAIPTQRTLMSQCASIFQDSHALRDWKFMVPLTPGEFIQLGNAMHHCVASGGYIERCIAGSTRIFQLYHGDDYVEDGVTIEASEKGRLKQIRGRHNREASEAELYAASEALRKLRQMGTAPVVRAR